MERRNSWSGIYTLLIWSLFLWLSFSPKSHAEIPQDSHCAKLLFRFLEHAQSRVSSQSSKALEEFVETLHPETPRDKTLRIGTINTYNLYLTRGRWVREWDASKSAEVWVRKSDPKTKDPKHTAEMAKIIKDLDLDIVILNEVEGISSVIRFIQEYLDLKYVPLIVNSNDKREISTAFLVKAGLPYKVDFDSHAYRTRVDYNEEGRVELPVFARDLPVLFLRNQDAHPDSRPLLTLFGAHFKSRRDGPNDPGSKQFRNRELQETKAIINDLRDHWGEDLPIILGGDMNSSMWTDEGLIDLSASLNLHNSVRVLDPNATESDTITHVYFPDKNSNHKVINQMDGFFVSESLTKQLTKSSVVHYVDELGNPKPIPDSLDSRKTQPSDHLPFYIEIRTDNF